MKNKYRIYVRTWWVKDKEYPGGRKPHVGRKRILGYTDSIEKARDWCSVWNCNHDPGFLSKKAEFEGI